MTLKELRRRLLEMKGRCAADYDRQTLQEAQYAVELLMSTTQQVRSADLETPHLRISDAPAQPAPAGPDTPLRGPVCIDFSSVRYGGPGLPEANRSF